MSPSKASAVALFICLLAAPGPAPAADPPRAPAPRRLAVVPFYAPEQMWRLYAPLVEFLRRETGEPWELALHPTHEALIEEFCAGRVDVALLGPVPLGRVNHRCGGLPVLVALGPGGTPTYRSVLLTADPEVTSVAALRGKEIGFFRGSTAAHAVPLRLLDDAGLAPGSYRPVYLESQDRLVAALLAGKISASGVKSALYERFRGERGLRVLATSGPLPNFAFAAPPSSQGRLDRFAAALRRVRPGERSADAELVGTWDDEIRHGFVAPTPEYLAAVLALQELTERQARDAR
jgi:phosphonate transport system substrate-binding protein